MRARGVFFDVGHGMGSFSWKTARAMANAEFWPDTISSDVHAMCIEGPAWDLLRTMTKFLYLGMPLEQVISSATNNAATAIGRPDLGTFAIGATGDASVLSLDATEIQLEDALGNVEIYDQQLFARGLVIDGAWQQALK